MPTSRKRASTIFQCFHLVLQRRRRVSPHGACTIYVFHLKHWYVPVVIKFSSCFDHVVPCFSTTQSIFPVKLGETILNSTRRLVEMSCKRVPRKKESDRTFFLGWWGKYKPVPTRSPDFLNLLVQEWAHENAELFSYISNLYKLRFPHVYSCYERLKISAASRLGIFPTGHLIINGHAKRHIDSKNVPVPQVLLVFGDFSGGELSLQEDGYIISFHRQPVTLVFFHAHSMYHFVRPSTGGRFSLQLFCHSLTLSKLLKKGMWHVFVFVILTQIIVKGHSLEIKFNKEGQLSLLKIFVFLRSLCCS